MEYWFELGKRQLKIVPAGGSQVDSSVDFQVPVAWAGADDDYVRNYGPLRGQTLAWSYGRVDNTCAKLCSKSSDRTQQTAQPGAGGPGLSSQSADSRVGSDQPRCEGEPDRRHTLDSREGFLVLQDSCYSIPTFRRLPGAVATKPSFPVSSPAAHNTWPLSTEPVASSAPRLPTEFKTNTLSLAAGVRLALLCRGQAYPAPSFRCVLF